ncbi:MAG: helix-turn-helix transcriptional regulator [Pseudomonadota bacterium]
MADKHDLSTHGGRIAHVIEAAGYTPASIAARLGCKPAAVYQWISGSTQNLKEALLWKLSDLTGFEARWISMGEGPQRIDPAIKHACAMLTAMEPGVRYSTVRLIDTMAEHDGSRASN